MSDVDIKLVSDGTGPGTKIFASGVEIKHPHAVSYTVDADGLSMMTVEFAMATSEVHSIFGSTTVSMICPICEVSYAHDCNR